MFKHIGGIQPDPENPGFKNIIIKPQIGGGISCASMHYDTTHGRVTTHWYIEDRIDDPNRLHLVVGVPTNTTATVWIPGNDLSLIKETGAEDELAYLADGVCLVDEHENEEIYIFTVSSGSYHFTSESESLFPFSCEFDCQKCLDCSSGAGYKPCYGCNPKCNPPAE